MEITFHAELAVIGTYLLDLNCIFLIFIVPVFIIFLLKISPHDQNNCSCLDIYNIKFTYIQSLVL